MTAFGHGTLIDRTAYDRGALSGAGVLSADVPSPLELVFFEVTGYFDAVAGSPVVEPVNGIVTFVPRLAGQQPLWVEDASVTLGAVIALIVDGFLSTWVPSDDLSDDDAPVDSTPGFQLVANQFGLRQLIYDVTLSDSDGHQLLAPFAFAASTDATPVCLTDSSLEVIPWHPPNQATWTPALSGRNWHHDLDRILT